MSGRRVVERGGRRTHARNPVPAQALMAATMSLVVRLPGDPEPEPLVITDRDVDAVRAALAKRDRKRAARLAKVVAS